MDNHKYTSEEVAGLYFIYGYCKGSARAARMEYSRKYGNRQLPSTTTIITTYRRISDSTIFRNIAAEN